MGIAKSLLLTLRKKRKSLRNISKRKKI